MKEIKELKDLFEIFKEIDLYNTYGVQKIGIFGSFARGESFNDIDIYIEDDIEFIKLMKLKNTLESLSGIQFDIITKKNAEPVILYRAFKDMKYAATN